MYPYIAYETKRTQFNLRKVINYIVGIMFSPDKTAKSP